MKVKFGEEKFGEILSQWQKFEKDPNQKKREREKDGFIVTLRSLGCSKVEITSTLKVGGYRVQRLIYAKPGDSFEKKPPPHAATLED